MSDGKTISRPLHECSVCHTVEEWGPSWEWFGSVAGAEDGKPVLKFCSPACRAKGPSGETFEFEGVGTIEATTTYQVFCGGCDAEESLDAATRKDAGREAEMCRWAKHPKGGWLCPTCDARARLKAELAKTPNATGGPDAT